MFVLGTEISYLGQPYSSISHKMTTSRGILEYKVSIGLYWSVHFNVGIQNKITNTLFALGIEM